MKGLDLPEPLLAFAERMNTRPFVRLALQHEGWLDAALVPAPGGENPSHQEN